MGASSVTFRAAASSVSSDTDAKTTAAVNIHCDVLQQLAGDADGCETLVRSCVWIILKTLMKHANQQKLFSDQPWKQKYKHMFMFKTQSSDSLISSL